MKPALPLAVLTSCALVFSAAPQAAAVSVDSGLVGSYNSYRPNLDATEQSLLATTASRVAGDAADKWFALFKATNPNATFDASAYRSLLIESLAYSAPTIFENWVNTSHELSDTYLPQAPVFTSDMNALLARLQRDVPSISTSQFTAIAQRPAALGISEVRFATIADLYLDFANQFYMAMGPDNFLNGTYTAPNLVTYVRSLDATSMTAGTNFFNAYATIAYEFLGKLYDIKGYSANVRVAINNSRLTAMRNATAAGFSVSYNIEDLTQQVDSYTDPEANPQYGIKRPGATGSSFSLSS
ncbi:MAG: hypothetical protein Q3972_08955 [Corynebacterium sp.]|nr:hypothetical protein [Corynebacterium sp.]